MDVWQVCLCKEENKVDCYCRLKDLLNVENNYRDEDVGSSEVCCRKHRGKAAYKVAYDEQIL